MTITLSKPKRPHRTAWWASCKAPGQQEQEHYICHDTFIRFDRNAGTIYRDPAIRVSRRDHTAERIKSEELLRKTGFMLIQEDGPNQEFKRWRNYVLEISELEIDGEDAEGGFWIKCRVRIIRVKWET